MVILVAMVNLNQVVQMLIWPMSTQVVAIATAALEGIKNEANTMVTALVDMERVFVPPQHFIRLVQRRMDRQRREEEIKTKSSKKAVEAEQSLLNRAPSPQTGGTSKSLKDSKQDKDTPKGPTLKTAGPEGEITAGFLLKKSAKANGWSMRWFGLNEKTGKLGYTKKTGREKLLWCHHFGEEIEEAEPPPSKSSKDKKKVEEKPPSLVFKITSKVAYKTVLKAHSVVLLKADSTVDKAEWLNKLRVVVMKLAQNVAQALEPVQPYPDPRCFPWLVDEKGAFTTKGGNDKDSKCFSMLYMPQGLLTVIKTKKPTWKLVSSISLKMPVKSLPKVLIDDDMDLIDEESLLSEKDLKKPQLPPVGDCEVGSTRKACKNCSCGRAEEEEKVKKLGITMGQLENPQSACGRVTTSSW
ncbi:Dynamin [Artemisia annua]|uniref:Dynamin n=1 Tax=Artemisia annua TaxID=35608 RepID=A0A2U1QP42_ARTAN|nr:Dynamin [Artemisia annua]